MGEATTLTDAACEAEGAEHARHIASQETLITQKDPHIAVRDKNHRPLGKYLRQTAALAIWALFRKTLLWEEALDTKIVAMENALEVVREGSATVKRIPAWEAKQQEHLHALPASIPTADNCPHLALGGKCIITL